MDEEEGIQGDKLLHEDADLYLTGLGEKHGVYEGTPPKKPGGIRLRARAVVGGNEQEDAPSHPEPPVVAKETLKDTLWSLAGACGWTMHTIDVTTAYLNAKLDEPEYVIMPYHCRSRPIDNNGGGLIIAPKTWYKEVKGFFTHKCKMQKSQRDPALFYKGKGEDAVAVAVYVDDMTIAGKEEKVLETKRKIAEEWQITDQGDTTYVLGLDVEREQRAVLLSRKSYIKQVAADYSEVNYYTLCLYPLLSAEADPLLSNI